MYKVVYNSGDVGLHLSKKAKEWLKKNGYDGDLKAIPRHNPLLVKCIEVLGDDAARNPDYDSLDIVIVDADCYAIVRVDTHERVVTPLSFNWVKP